MNNINYENHITYNDDDSNISHASDIIQDIFSNDEIRLATNSMNIVSKDSMNIVSKDSMNIVSKDSMNIVSNDSINIISNDDNIKITNGWDKDANITIENWYNIFKQQSFMYQLILDKNMLISDRLAVLSIISSTSLGLFTGFKLWKENDMIFQTTSNIILMLSNFSVAIMTTISKRYIDDKRNETIRQYITNVDIFLGEISAQLLKSTHYRMNADEFFKINNDKYTSLISSAPNLSISEIEYGKIKYNNYKKYIV
jgi:hypothetical protein